MFSPRMMTTKKVQTISSYCGDFCGKSIVIRKCIRWVVVSMSRRKCAVWRGFVYKWSEILSGKERQIGQLSARSILMEYPRLSRWCTVTFQSILIMDLCIWTSHTNKARNRSSNFLISAICVWLVRNRNAGADKVNKKY